jgi:hypothetical protein
MTGEVAGCEGRRAFGECCPGVAGVEDKGVYNVLLDGLLAASFATLAWSMLSDNGPGPPVWRSISKTKCPTSEQVCFWGDGGCFRVC